jgi:hypothetical protein
MTTITDEQMTEGLAHTKPYTLVILHDGPNRHMAGVDAVIWEHGRRNFALRADGVLPIVCPIADSSDVCGIGILNLGLDEAAAIMAGDPGVQAGVFTYQLHPTRSFPGDTLPA